MNEMKDIEILAPASNIAMIMAAIAGKANSVYFGVNEGLNMRIHNANFRLDELNDIVKLCHDNGIRAYITINSVIYDDELDIVYRLVDRANSAGVDAFIIHDHAVINIVREFGGEFHISTMANICNSVAAKEWEKRGASRLILARELNLLQIKKIVENVDIDIEVFVHGALCMAVSGHCFLSYFLEGKSALRGQCVSPCRWPYNAEVTDPYGRKMIFETFRIMSSRDLCLIYEIPALIKAGVKVFKIEGRRRNPEYVEVVSRCYREATEAALDNSFDNDQVRHWMKLLKTVYHRGFCEGYIYGSFHKETFHVDTDGSDRATRERIEVGQVLKYMEDRQVALIEVRNEGLRSGDEIIIVGQSFLRQKLTHLEIVGRFTDEVEPPAEILISVQQCVFSGDKVYLLREKVYKPSRHSEVKISTKN